MSSIKQVNAMFKKALANDGKIDAKEARQIAQALKKSGVSGAEKSAVSAQVREHRDAFKSGARKALSKVSGHTPPPEFPGAKASPEKLQKWEKAMHKFFDDQKPAPIRERATKNRSAFDGGGKGSGASAATGSSGGATGSHGGGTIEDRAIKEIGNLKEPKFPGNDATEAELAKFQKDMGKYNRMLEMYSKIMANAHEMKKALIGNLPRG